MAATIRGRNLDEKRMSSGSKTGVGTSTPS
jgi:hypothetical protein